MTTFETAFATTVAAEGKTLDLTTADAGNWTGGSVGAGQLRGSKFGISAAAYPLLDIPGLTLAASQEIYRRDYWDRIRADELPPPLALLAFDAAVNNGVRRAVLWLQATAGVTQDGNLGPVTMAAIASAETAHGGAALCIEFMARRTFFMGSLQTWSAFGLGWSRRLAALPFHAVLLARAT